MAAKNCRNMKVYEQSGYHYKSTPAIMLKGRTKSGGLRLCADRSGSEDLWLKEFGFSEGTQIQVQ